MTGYDGKERRIHEDRRKHWIDRWARPSVVLAFLTFIGGILSSIVGGIVWGIQLNSIVVHQGGRIIENSSKIEQNGERVDKLATIQAEVTTLLGMMNEEIRDNQDKAKEHYRTSEEWRQRIVKLEAQAAAVKEFKQSLK